jgi:flagellar hook assembly protein FlgD
MQFDVPSGGGPLTLEIHNSRGQLVKSLVEHHPGRGRHTVTWDGTDLRGRQVSSGIYFARLVTGQTLSTQKLILMR